MMALKHVYNFRVPCSCLYVNGKGCADAERPIDIDPFTWYFVTKQIEGSICCYSQQIRDSFKRVSNLKAPQCGALLISN